MPATAARASISITTAGATSRPTADITDNVMAEIILLEERKDRRKDLFNLVSGILVGLLAISAVYFFVDPL